uniref:Uncharacterized protein n=1 Tax=Triticum urartu TaxID=4572 RepID=A0A8R7U889_TRIUA
MTYKVVRMPRDFLYACDHEILVLSRDILFGEIKSLQISESLDLFGGMASLYSFFVGRIFRVWSCFLPCTPYFFITWDGLIARGMVQPVFY